MNILPPPNVDIACSDTACLYCNREEQCTNGRCAFNGMPCHSTGCEHRCYESFHSYMPRQPKPKRWRKVKSMEDTFYPNARFI